MSLFGGSSVLEVICLEDGRFGVRATGGTILGGIVQTFVTQNEAEDWMMKHTAFSRAGSGILKPGCSQNVA